MNDCLELLTELVAIYIVPSDGDFINPMPARMVRSTVNAQTLSHKSEPQFFDELKSKPAMISEGYYTVDAPAGTLEIKDYPSIKVSPKTNAGGRYLEVTITAKSTRPIEEVLQYANDIRQYESTDAYLLDSEGNWYVVRGMSPGNELSASYKLPNKDAHDITYTSSNVNGVQRIV